MAATYTYNDAIDDAIRIVVKSWEKEDHPELSREKTLTIIGNIQSLKRPSRRKRKSVTPSSGSEG